MKQTNWGAIGTIIAVISIAFAVGVFVSTRASTNKKLDSRVALLEKYIADYPTGTILPWDPVIRDKEGNPTGQLHTLPDGWAICNGINGTPNLVDRFLIGAGDLKRVGNTGGRKDIPDDGKHAHSGKTGVTKERGVKKENGNDGKHTHTHSHTISEDGKHNHGGDNLPPYYTLIYIIKKI